MFKNLKQKPLQNSGGAFLQHQNIKTLERYVYTERVETTNSVVIRWECVSAVN